MINKQMVTVGLSLAALAMAGCKPDSAGQMGGYPPTQVVVAEAKRQPVSENLSLVGTVAADEMVELHSEIDGTVQEVKFEEGKPVEKGQLLIQLDPTKLAASVAEAEANFKLSQANYERVQSLLKGSIIGQQEFDQANSTFEVNKALLDRKKRELKDTQIFAPFAGVMGSRMISPGQVINKDSKLTSLVALDPVKIEVNVPERFLSQVQNGQKIEVSVATYASEKFKGDVFFIAPQVDAATRTALVKARVANTDFRLKPGMFANMELTLKIKENAVVIPESALILNGESINVAIVDADQKAQFKAVKVGIRMAGAVEIIDGLQGGEKVITEGFQKVRPGAPVKIASDEPAPAQMTGEKKETAKAGK
jgi:membrane fusion protein (multidrug efflux system)